MKKSYRSEPEINEEKEDHLPSVSSLIEKYKDAKAKKTNLMLKSSNRNDVVWKLFG